MHAQFKQWVERVFALLGAYLFVEELTDVDAADVDAIKTSIASAATAQSYSGADLDGAVGAGTMSPPRNITITTSAHANIDAVDVLITGKDIYGNTMTEEITLTDGGGVTDVGAKAFASVEQIDVPAQSGTGGALEFGFGDLIGLARPIKSRAGGPHVLHQREGTTIVTNGVFASQAVGAPNGTYAPNTVPDGSQDYVITYEVDYPEFREHVRVAGEGTTT